MNIVVLCPHFAPDMAPTGEVISAITLRLAARGHRLHVVTSLPWYRHHATEPGWDGQLVRHEDTNWGRITRVHPFPTDKTNIPARALAFGGFTLLSVIEGVLTSARPDVVLAMSPPITLGAAGWAVARSRRAPFVFNIQDVFPDVAVDLGLLTNKRAIAAARRLEVTTYRHADAGHRAQRRTRRQRASQAGRGRARPPSHRGCGSRPCDPQLCRHLSDLAPAGTRWGPVPVAVRPGGSHRGDVRRQRGSQPVAGPGAPRRPHHGSPHRRGVRHQRWRVGSPVADGVGRRARQRGVRGHAAPPPTARGAGGRRRPRGAAAHRACGIQRAVQAVFHPAAGRPIVASVDPGTEVQRTVEAAGAGLAVPPDDPEAFTGAVGALVDDPVRRRAMGAAGRSFVEGWASPEAVALAYEQLFDRLIAERSRYPVGIRRPRSSSGRR